MNDERIALRIYQQALELEGSERQAFIQRETGGDPDLERQVAGLLQSSERAEACGFLDRPATENVKALGALPSQVDRPREAPPEIDRYHLITRLGEGGFGTVYLAEQLEPVRREVALKLIRADRCDENFARRFEAEQQVLALLNHPGIAQIYDAGTTADGDPYLVMERIDGEPITDYCARHRLGLRRRIELFMKVCAALQHAHQKGVIHRDIKPANVLVTERDGVPVAKVIDFGIARVADLRVNENTIQTVGGALGSPGYMSPEQVEPTEGIDIDTRADVYSLGVLLYEMLVGALPFESSHDSLLDMLRQILESDPPRPSERARSLAPEVAMQQGTTAQALARRLQGDLDWIVLKTLEKDRDRRYESAAALAADLHRHLIDEPVEAGPPNLGYRAAKFIHRNALGVAAACLLVVTLIAGLIGTGIGFLNARQEAQNARQTLQLLQEFLSSPDPALQGRDLTVVQLLENFTPRLEALSDRPGIQADLLQTYAATYLGLGLFDRAAGFAERALAVQIELHDQTHPATLAATSLLGSIRLEQGSYDESAALQRKAHETARVTLGPDHRDTIDYAVGLAEALEKSGDYGQAAALHREAYEKRRILLGPNHEDTLHSMNRLGLALFMGGEQDEGLAWAREAAQRRAEHFGPDHPETLHAMSNLSFNLGEMGRYQEAAALDREILERRERVLGEEHRKTIVSMINLAWILDKLARYEESIALNRRALEILERTLGHDNPDALVTKANLAMVMLRQGDLETAEGMMREVIAARSRILGPEHPVTLVGIGNLVSILQQQLRLEEAIPMVRDLIERRSAVQGPEHHSTLVAQTQLSSLLSAAGNYEEAESWARKALEPRIALSGPESIATSAVKLDLARALIGRAKLDEAETLVQDVITIRTHELGEAHPGTVSAIEAQAELLVARGAVAEARSLYQQALDRRAAGQGPDHPQTRKTRQRLAALVAAASSEQQ